MGLYGEEYNYYVVSDGKGGHKSCENKCEIVNYEEPLANWEKWKGQPGQFSYPFELTLPDWLPASLFVFPFGATKLKIQYFLIA